MVDEQTHVFQQRPAMYLLTHAQKLNAGSIFLNFLHALFDSLEFGNPRHIELTSTGYYFHFLASGCTIDLEKTGFGSFEDVFDIANHRVNPSSNYPQLLLLRSAVWYTEYCLVDITTSVGLHRHAYFLGKPLPQSAQIHPTPQEGPQIGFCFTVLPSVFEETRLSRTDFQEQIEAWHLWVHEASDKKPLPVLSFNWQEQSPYHHSLRIVVND